MRTVNNGGGRERKRTLSYVRKTILMREIRGVGMGRECRTMQALGNTKIGGK